MVIAVVSIALLVIVSLFCYFRGLPPFWKEVKSDDVLRSESKYADISYQLLIYSFADSDGDGVGDFKGAESKLEYISSLGVNAVWLSPMHPSPSYHGYDVSDYYSVRSEYGSIDDFKHFVNEAHKWGIKVYIDFVVNHTSVKNPWFVSAINDDDSPYRSFYNFSVNPQSDIENKRIEKIKSSGSESFDVNQWHKVGERVRRLTFRLFKDDDSLSVMVEKGDSQYCTPKSNKPSQYYLYYGDGCCRGFSKLSDNEYVLTIDYQSDWGFLVRSSDDSWEYGTKFGVSSDEPLRLGETVCLTNNDDALNITLDLPEYWYYHSCFFTDTFADLNYGSADSCEYSPAFAEIVNAAKYWIDNGADGLRVDAVKHVYRSVKTDENPKFLKKFYDAVNSHYRQTHNDNLYVVAEVLSEHDEVSPFFASVPSLFDFSFWWRLQWSINNGVGKYFVGDIMSYREEYRRVNSCFNDCIKLSNHDEMRTASALGLDIRKCGLAACVLMTSPGSPYIYYGEEIGLYGTQSGGDEYVRSPMLWGDGMETHPFDKIDSDIEKRVQSVVRQSSDSLSLLSLYRRLGVLRNSHPALGRGEMYVDSFVVKSKLNSSALSWWEMKDDESGERLIVVHNFSADTVRFSTRCIGESLFTNGEVKMSRLSVLSDTVMMGGYSSAVWRRKS